MVVILLSLVASGGPWAPLVVPVFFHGSKSKRPVHVAGRRLEQMAQARVLIVRAGLHTPDHGWVSLGPANSFFSKNALNGCVLILSTLTTEVAFVFFNNLTDLSIKFGGLNGVVGSKIVIISGV